MSFLRSLSFAAAGLLAAPAAHAFTMGIPGKSIDGCGGAGCHAGGVEPVVALMTPGQVAPGATVQLQLTVRGGQTAAGATISAEAGVLLPADDALRANGRELVQNGAALPYEGDEAVFVFDWTAPDEAGPVTLYAAGNSVNLDRLPSGDAFAVTSATIEVGDGGGAGGAGGGAAVDMGAGGSAAADMGTGGSAAADMGTASGGGDDGGCTTGGGTAPLFSFGFVLLALGLFRRRD